jgi:Rrf2 family protein
MISIGTAREDRVRLNTRGRYGIQLMAQLACHTSSRDPLGLKQVAAATGLPWRYLEQIARPLRAAALVKGRAGRTGGYVLTRAPDRITLLDVLDATAGPMCLMACVDRPDSCERSSDCTSRQVWLAITTDIRDVLSRYTLCDLAKRPCAGCRSDVETARATRAGDKRNTNARPDVALAAVPSRRGRQPAKVSRARSSKQTGVSRPV